MAMLAYAKMKVMVAHSWIQSFVMTFIPLFIVIDAVGNLPFVISLSEGLDPRETQKVNYHGYIDSRRSGAILFIRRPGPFKCNGHFGGGLCHCRRHYFAGAFDSIHDHWTDGGDN